MKTRKIQFITLATLALMLASCGSNPKKPGRIWMPDMTYSNAYETYAPSAVRTPEGDKMSARTPVKGTIPRGWIPDDEKIRTTEAYLMSYMAKEIFVHTPAKWQEEYDKAGAIMKDPLTYSDENMAEGKRLYEINCKVCHGEKGDGAGQIVELPDGSDGPFTARPPAYNSRLPEIKDGNMFYAISYGKGMMGPHAYQLDVKERWQVIHYIKSLAGITPSATDTAATTATTKK